MIAEFRGVSFGYSEAPLFEDLSYRFKEKTFYLIQGRFGIGKSTLLRLMTRLENPTGGEIRFQGTALSDYDPPILRRRIVYIQQLPTVLDASIRQNLLLPFTFSANKDYTRPDDEELKALLDRVHLPPDGLNQNAMSLSVGQLQRICLVRGLMLSPDMILLDEPTSALDDESARVVQAMVEEVCSDSGITVVMVNHRAFRPQKIEPVVLKLAEGRLTEAP